jgi:hypothetical protein
MLDDHEQLADPPRLHEEMSSILCPTERRWPGRPQDVSPGLVPLLRYDAEPERIEGTREWLLVPEDPDDGRWSGRGIAGGLVLSAFFWVALSAFLA